MSTINWIPIADCPDELKDGRRVLIWCRGWDSAVQSRLEQRGRFVFATDDWEPYTPDYVAPMPKGPEVGRG
jgi:hypothetical protein